MHMTKQKQKKQRRTSLMADLKTHDYLKKLSSKLGISQTKCLAMIVDEKTHRDKIERKRKAEEFEEFDIVTVINTINQHLEKIEKRENPRDTIVAFFKTQEREILKPMREEIRLLLIKLDSIIEALSIVN